MKNKKKLQKEIDFVRTRLGDAPAVPESLSRENVEAAVSGKKQRTPVKKTVRRVVSAAVAACIALSVTALWRASVYAPRFTADAATYGEVGRLLRDYNRAQSTREFFFNGWNSGMRKAADGIPQEESIAGGIRDYGEDKAADSAATAGGFTETTGGEYGKTNTRETDVAEEDILKTDGEYLYLLANSGSFRVVRADGAEMECVASLELNENAVPWADGRCRYESYSGFYLTQRYVIFVGTVFESTDYEGTSRTSVRIFDKSALPELRETRSLTFDGDLEASRFTDGKLVIVTQFYPDAAAVDYNDYKTYIPTVCADGETSYLPEDRIYIGSADEAESFTTVAMFTPESDAQIERCAVFGGGAEIYCTSDALYVSRTCWSSGYFFRSIADADVVTNILSFDISGSAPVLTARGSVPGYLLNTFALDAYSGYLRAAVTYNDRIFVYVLDGNLETVGVSPALAEGEQIYGVRFSGNTAYVVTFYQTDPLFVLDLSDPAAPTLKGELKLPGFSSYLHPVGAGLMLGVGRGGDENGTDGSAKLSLFDVSDPQQPREAGSLILPDAWFNDDYKAFVDMGDGSYLLPYDSWTWQTVTDENGVEDYSGTNECGVLRFYAENGALLELGRYLPAAELDGGARATFIGGTVYLIAETYAEKDGFRVELFAFDRDAFTQTGALTLSVPTSEGFGWGYAYGAGGVDYAAAY